MTIHKALHPRDDVDTLYVSRKGGKELASIADSIDASIRRLEARRKRGERLITATKNDTDNTRTVIIRKQKWEEKQLYGRLSDS